jgi:hypothetical protein
VSDIGWVILGATVGYGGLAAYTAGLVVRARRTRRALVEATGGTP